jgi:hypothetical protein
LLQAVQRRIKACLTKIVCCIITSRQTRLISRQVAADRRKVLDSKGPIGLMQITMRIEGWAIIASFAAIEAAGRGFGLPV